MNSDDFRQANAAMRASLAATHAKLDAAGVGDPAMRPEDRIEHVLRDLALALRVGSEVAAECARLRTENERLTSELGEALQVIADGVGVETRMMAENERLRGALEPFAEFATAYLSKRENEYGGPPRDDEIVYAFNDTQLTVGDLRLAALAPRAEEGE